jgi:hypothetical protein
MKILRCLMSVCRAPMFDLRYHTVRSPIRDQRSRTSPICMREVHLTASFVDNHRERPTSKDIPCTKTEEEENWLLGRDDLLERG